MTNVDTAAEAPRSRRNRSAEPDVQTYTAEGETPTAGGSQDITIAGHSFTVRNRYTEGHVLTAGEAAQLNQVVHENIRNNMTKKVKESGLSHEELQRLVTEYEDRYEPGVRQGGGRTADPVRREAIALARAKVIETLRQRGESEKDYTAAALREAAEANAEKFMEKARRIVAERQSEENVEISLSRAA